MLLFFASLTLMAIIGAVDASLARFRPHYIVRSRFPNILSKNKVGIVNDGSFTRGFLHQNKRNMHKNPDFYDSPAHHGQLNDHIDRHNQEVDLRKRAMPIPGHGRWQFELEPLTEEFRWDQTPRTETETYKNPNYVRIVGRSGGPEMDAIYQFPDDTDTVELVFVDLVTEPRITYHKLANRWTGRVLIKVLTQKDPIRVTFERKINRVISLD